MEFKLWFGEKKDDLCASCGHERKFHRDVGSAGYCEICGREKFERRIVLKGSLRESIVQGSHNFTDPDGYVDWADGDRPMREATR